MDGAYWLPVYGLWRMPTPTWLAAGIYDPLTPCCQFEIEAGTGYSSANTLAEVSTTSMAGPTGNPFSCACSSHLFIGMILSSNVSSSVVATIFFPPFSPTTILVLPQLKSSICQKLYTGNANP